MRRVAVLASVVALAACFVALAGHTAARPDAADTAGIDFVGSWRVEVTIPGQPGYAALATYMADGTTVHSRSLAQPAAPGSPFAVVLSGPAHGEWEATGDRESRTTFVGLLTDERGTFLGTATITGAQRLSDDGGAYTGEYVTTITDPTGAVVATVPGTATAVRIAVEPASPSGSLPATPRS